MCDYCHELLESDRPWCATIVIPNWLQIIIIIIMCHNGLITGSGSGLQWLYPQCHDLWSITTDVQRVRSPTARRARNQSQHSDIPLPEQSASCTRISLSVYNTVYFILIILSVTTVWYGRMSAPSRVRFWWMTHLISFVPRPSVKIHGWHSSSS